MCKGLKMKYENEIITVRFGGFYYSIHKDFIEYAIESYNSNESGEMGAGLDDVIYDLSYDDFHKKLEMLYLSDYVDMINEFLETDFKLDSLWSPKFYNFETDEMLLAGFVSGDMNKIRKFIIKNGLRDNLESYIKDVRNLFKKELKGTKNYNKPIFKLWDVVGDKPLPSPSFEDMDQSNDVEDEGAILPFMIFVEFIVG